VASAASDLEAVGDWPTVPADQSPEDVPGPEILLTSSSSQPSSWWPSSSQPSSSPFRITSSGVSSVRRDRLSSPRHWRRPHARRPRRLSRAPPERRAWPHGRNSTHRAIRPNAVARCDL